ncbi:MAG: hypothetical protein H6623_01200 [Bdellovibrionaceae bacterium]|nr:hypothetical protein [Pseudobdellovibrionaceae bacterium]
MKKQTFCFLIHLPQDLDLLSPIIEDRLSKHHQVICLVYKKMLPKSPRIMRYLQEMPIQWQSVESKVDFLKAVKAILFSRVVISAVETSARPHKFGYFFTRLANLLGKKTITMQHGLENIGLTYSDTQFPIKDIQFASKKILIWSDTSQLHPHIRQDTKNKCIPFGCTKRFSVATELKKPAPFVVGVFENLHWNRYDDLFRNQFIEDFIVTAQQLPEITFLIKPHHEGRWLTDRCKLDFNFPKNILILDPKSPQWEPYTGPAIVSISDVVVTTPSTIALDAAVLQKPILISGYNLDVQKYAPLPILKNTQDWINHIRAIYNKQENLDSLSQKFVQKNLFDSHCIDHLDQVL